MFVPQPILARYILEPDAYQLATTTFMLADSTLIMKFWGPNREVKNTQM
jgi:hypothetical protein